MLGMDAEPGIYLQTLTDLFQAIEKTQDNMEYSVSMSYLEVSWFLCLSWINCKMGTILTACAELRCKLPCSSGFQLVLLKVF